MGAGMIERRSFITGLISLVAAPAIVRVGSLMPVRSMVGLDEWGSSVEWQDLVEAQRQINLRHSVALNYAERRWITLAEALEMFPDREATA
jgi:hypothetical protein